MIEKGKPIFWTTMTIICITFVVQFPPNSETPRTPTETQGNWSRGQNSSQNRTEPNSEKRQQSQPKSTTIFDVELRKCRNWEDGDNFLVIPPNLRVPHEKKFLRELTASFGNKLYNFTLKYLDGENETEHGKIFNLNFVRNYTEHVSAKNRNSSVTLYAQTLHYFTPFGFFKTNRTFHHPKNYCILKITNETISAKIIEQNHVTRLPKCCPMGMVTTQNLANSTDKMRCSFISTPEFVPYVYNNAAIKKIQNDSNSPLNFEYKPINRNCLNRVVTIPWTPQRARENLPALVKQIKILKNGHVVTRVSGNHDWEEPEENYCLDGFLDPHESTKFEGQEDQLILMKCQELKKVTQDQNLLRIVSLVYLTSYSISFIFFLLIIAIYGLIWTKQNIHGWTIVSFSFCGMVNSLCILMGYAFGLLDFNKSRTHSPTCIALGIVGHFFNISFFSWLTLLNYDLWVTIRSMKPKSERSKGKRRFLVYCLLGFGLPALSVSISNLIEHNFGFFDDRVIRPQYGRTRCFVDKSAALVHATAPNTILFLFNIFLAFLTLKTLWEFKKGTKFLQTAQSTKRTQSKFALFGKLSMLMGFSWVFEVLSNLIGNQREKLIFLWLIFDLYNAIQVIYLCWIFISKKDVRVHLATKYKIFDVSFSFAGRTLSRWKSQRTTMALKVTPSRHFTTPSKSRSTEGSGSQSDGAVIKKESAYA